MVAVFYWGSLVLMILCGGVFIYGIVKVVKNWKTASLEGRSKILPQFVSVFSMGVVCFIVFLITGLFYEPFKKEQPSMATENRPNINLSIADDYTFENQDEILKYFKIFLIARPSIQKYVNAIENAKASLMDLTRYDYTYEDYGWTKQIYIEIKLKDRTDLPRGWGADGQTLHYIIGSGNTPGIVAKKAVSQVFADMPVDDSADTFVPVPELAGIDEIGE
jgi:hypothetical protein